MIVFLTFLNYDLVVRLNFILVQIIGFLSMLTHGYDVGNPVRGAAIQVTKPSILVALKLMAKLKLTEDQGYPSNKARL